VCGGGGEVTDVDVFDAIVEVGALGDRRLQQAPSSASAGMGVRTEGQKRVWGGARLEGVEIDDEEVDLVDAVVDARLLMLVIATDSQKAAVDLDRGDSVSWVGRMLFLTTKHG
jgi:hypothetical protein